MKNSAPLLVGPIKTSNKHNGHGFENNDSRPQPNLRARMRYGARLKRAARFEEEEIDSSFRLTSKTRNGISSHYIE
jgi:hypothetical protein